MENIRPHGPRLDLAKVAQGSRDPARMLISPPPEDELRQQRTPKTGSMSKRKRTVAQPNQLTPNPKPRKQVRNERTPSPTRTPKLVLLQSPHLNNPNADYLPAPAVRRRSATPSAVPYEPPKDVFTPPREVIIITPTVTTPRRRTRAKPKPPVIKTEPPAIDLSEPMPPASPTDDPLLLTGPPSQASLPPSTPPRRPSSSPNDAGWGTTSDSMDLDTRPAVDILFPNAADLSGSWSDSDSDDDDELMHGESEFTGKWRMSKIPTKQDPPSSATRCRQDSWGRPISPHPFRRRVSKVAEEDEEEEDEEDTATQHQEQSDDEEEEREVRAMSVEVDDNERDNEVPVADYDDDEPMADAQQPQDAPDVHLPDDNILLQEKEHDDYFSVEISPPAGVQVEEDDEAEEEEVRAMSVDREDAPSPQLASHGIYTPRTIPAPLDTQLDADAGVEEGSDDDESDSEGVDVGLVKITSKDPLAAATVAAILKQYNYDCFTKAKLKGSQSRRKTLDGGIQKRPFATPPRQRPRSFGGVIGDKVYIPGSPVTTLDNLLEQAEVEVKSNKQALTFREPEAYVYNGSGGAWTKEEWKVLDMCFTEERYELGGGGDDMANVDDVQVPNVVARFEELVPYGEWNKDDVERRVTAIRNKQRGGNVAPPLTPRGTPTRSRVENPFLARAREASMDVPDFTPLGRRAMPPARVKKGSAPSFRLPEPLTQGAPFQNLGGPSALLAPRYTHLLDEAHAIASGRPRLVVPEPEPESQEDEEEEEADTSLETSIDESVDDSREESFDESRTEEILQTPVQQTTRRPRTSIGNRVKGFLFSYLPSTAKTEPVKKRAAPRPNQLPPPPIGLLDKPRGPITTPVKVPEPKAPSPKDIVDLQHVEQPKPKSMIPRKLVPRRMVDLNHISPEKEVQKKPVADMRPRRSSGASVKDMIQGFEELRKSQSKAPEIKRTKSVGDLRNKAAPAGRPVWR